MTDHTLCTRAARVEGRSPARAGVFALGLLVALAQAALGPAPLAQTVTWELLPLVPFLNGQRVPAVGFLRADGAQADDPAADSLVMFHQNGVYVYNPSGGAGAAGDNGDSGAWHKLCPHAGCDTDDGLVTAAGSVVKGRTPSRGTGRARTWTFDYEGGLFEPYFETTLPALRGPTGAPAIFAGSGDDGQTVRSLADGAPGTWTLAGTGFGYPQSFGEVPPSAALPAGRILIGVWNGISYSDDGGMTYVRSSAYGFARYIVWSFTFRPAAGHPYGGTVFAGVQNVATGGDVRGAEVLRSDDGGATWTLVRAFTAAEIELVVPARTEVTEVVVFVTPDGALWAGVSQSGGAGVPRRGGVMRSADAGASWSRADAGFRNASGWGYAVNQFRLSRTGVLYAATERGVWRTTGAVVAGEASPVEAPVSFGVSVRPNPAGGRVEVVVSLAAAGAVRVAVLDALGREVAVVLDGAAAAGERAAFVDTGSWPAGVYVVRATAGARVATARLVVAR